MISYSIYCDFHYMHIWQKHVLYPSVYKVISYNDVDLIVFNNVGVTSLKVNNEASSVAKTTVEIRPNSPLSSPESLPDITSATLKFFNYQTLQASSMNFHLGRLLGRGLSGNVFKGWIDPPTHRVAVRARYGVAISIKKFESADPRGHREWLVSFPPDKLLNKL